MTSLGHDPELEERMFCTDCRGGAHGQVISYDQREVRELLAADRLALGERCVRCGVEIGEGGRPLTDDEREHRREEARRRHDERGHRPHAEERKEAAEFKEEDKSHRR